MLFQISLASMLEDYMIRPTYVQKEAIHPVVYNRLSMIRDWARMIDWANYCQSWIEALMRISAQRQLLLTSSE